MDEPSSSSRSSLIKYNWPSLYVPNNVTLSQFIQEKFKFFSNDIFLIDSATERHYLYRHVLHDSFQVYKIFKSAGGKPVSTTSTSTTTTSSTHQLNRLTIGIVGCNNFEHVTTIFGALLAEATIVLLDPNYSQEQILIAIKQCQITKLAVLRPTQQVKQQEQWDDERIDNLKQQYKMSYSISFEDINGRDLNNNDGTYFVDDDDDSNQNHNNNVINRTEDYQIPLINNQQNCDKRIRIMVPRFKRNKLIKVYQINEYSLISQLTYATLPQCGFEWNINDIVLNMKPFSDFLGILELMAAFSVGARIVIHSGPIPNSIESFVTLLNRLPITACIVDSSYLIGLIKSSHNLNRLRKLIYIKQPIHQYIVNLFKDKFQLCNCRYGYYLLEASGFVAIEILNHSRNSPISVVPLPLIQIMIMNRTNRDCCPIDRLGKIFVRTPYRATIVFNEKKRLTRKKVSKNYGWIYTGHVGYYDQLTCFQIIDHYRNFIKHKTNFISKSLLETILLTSDQVEDALVLRNYPNLTNKNHKNNQSQFKTFQAFVKQKMGYSCSIKELDNLLDERLNSFGILWNLKIVSEIRRKSKHCFDY